MEEVTVKNPYNITAWETLAEAYEKSAEVYIAKGEINKAEQLLEKCLSIPERIIELNRKSPKEDPGVEKLTATKNLMLYLAKAEKLSLPHSIDKSERYLDDYATDRNNDAEKLLFDED